MKTYIYIYVFGILNIQCPITIFRDEKTKKRMLKYSQQWRGKCQKLINQSQPSIWLEVSTRPKCPRKMTVSTANRDLTTTHENWSNHACEFKQLHKHKVVRKHGDTYYNQCFNRVTEQTPGQTWPNNIQWRWLNKAKSLPDESQSIDAKFRQQFETLIVGNNTFFPTKRWFRGLWTKFGAVDEVCVLAWGEVHIFFPTERFNKLQSPVQAIKTHCLR
jgi:hypothetical protein